MGQGSVSAADLIRKFVLTLVFLGVFLSSVGLAEMTKRKTVNNQKNKGINDCADSEFGIRFYCQADWKWKRVDDAILIIISENPTVTMTVSKVEVPIKYLSQLTRELLGSTGLYEEGFQTEFIEMSGKNVLQVKAFSKYDGNIRLNDFYYIRHNHLYGILFSVNPKDAWDSEQYKIKKIKESLAFLE